MNKLALKVIYTNADSFINKFDELQTRILDDEIDIAVIATLVMSSSLGQTSHPAMPLATQQ